MSKPNKPWGVARLTLSLIPAYLLLSVTTFAQSEVWTHGGPSGGDVRAFAINPDTPSTVFSATVGGVFRSIDSGSTWLAVNNGLANRNVSAIAIDPTPPSSIVYAGTQGGGVFKSTNSGDTWVAVNSGGLQNGNVGALAIDPTLPATVYAGLSNGVFRSTDSGGTWASASAGMTNTNVLALAINPLTPSTLFAGTVAGLFKSTDSGDSWVAANDGLTNTNVRCLAIKPAAGSTLYAGTTTGVFKTTNSGGTWVAASTGITDSFVRALAIGPGGLTIYAGTTNGGGGVFKSTDAGDSWVAANNGLLNRNVSAVATDPTPTGTLYAGTSGGVFKSTNSAGVWATSSAGLTSVSVRALAIDPASPSTLYAGTTGGIFKSTDFGGTWAEAYSGLTGSGLFVVALAINPATPSTVYAGTNNGVFKSLNSGVTWAAASTGITTSSVRALAIDPGTPSTLYAGTFAGVFRTTNSGATWTAVNAGLTSTSVFALVFTAPTIYAGTVGGVFVSHDNGGSWATANNGLTTLEVRALAIDPAVPSTLYAGTVGGGVFKTTNSGASWAPANTGITNTAVLALAVNPNTTPSSIYAGSGVFKSTDSGGTWTAISSGLPPSSAVNALSFHAGGVRVYAGLNGDGVWQADVRPAVSVADGVVVESDSGNTSVDLALTLSGGSSQPVTVAYATANGSATAPGDYTSTLGTLTFSPGQTSRSISVPVAGDTLDEADETFVVNLSSASNATLADGQATVTITDDDPLPALAIADTVVNEGDAAGLSAALTVILTPVSGRSVTVAWTATPGTATAPEDYTTSSGTLTLAAGQTSGTVLVPITGDVVPEVTESFSVNLDAATNATFADSSANVTIRDDDPAAADFGGDGTSDVVVYRAGAWLPFDFQTGNPLSGVFTGQPQAGCIPAPADFDGNGALAFSQLCGDKWYFYGPAGTLTKTITTGGTGSDYPVPADYDGDGKDDVVLFRAGAWLFYSYSTGLQTGGVFTGNPPPITGTRSIPYPADFDGDGKADFSIYSGGPWHFYNPDGSYSKGIWSGSIAGDIPVAGDYDGDGVDDVVVWRAGSWLWFDYGTGLYDGTRSVFTGAPPHFTGGVPTPSPIDVDGDGKLDRTVYSGGPWHFFNPDGTYHKGIWCGAVAGDLPISRRALP